MKEIANRVSRSAGRAAPDEEISVMLNSIKERDAVSVALVAGTGLRIGEALAVRINTHLADTL
jgi:integrase